MNDANADLGRKFFAAVNARDWDTMIACYTSDARIWHSNDKLWVDVEKMVSNTKPLFAAIPDFTWNVAAVTATAAGFVAQGTLTGTMAGKPFDVPVVAVAEVTGSAISKVEEYIDASHFPRP